MTDPPSPADHSSADLCGLPQRLPSQGRDRLEEIASEYLDRLRAGETLNIETFIANYPHLKTELAEFLPLVAAMEDWKEHRELKAIKRPLPEHFEFTHLGEFQIIQELARGGMGVVFEALQPSLNRRVALKLLPWRFPKKSAWAEQFLREARIAAGLQHAHIVPIYSFGEQDDHYFYAMQLIEGIGLDKLIQHWSQDVGVVSIEDLIRQYRPSLAVTSEREEQKRSKRLLRRDSWQQLGRIATQIASAIRYAHHQKTLHRDIKPGNILIDMQGKVWITDFGLAIGREPMLRDDSGPLAGTIRYMAPEQFRGGGDERSDLYSFGVTLYELATLTPAFQGRTQRELAQEVQRGKIPAPRSINPEIPARFERVIVKATAADPQARYQTADQLHADLLGFLNASNRPDTIWQRVRKWF